MVQQKTIKMIFFNVSFRKSTAAHDIRSNFMGILKHSVKVIIWSNDTGKSK